MKQRVRTRILAVLMTAMMILTLTPTVYADDENPSKQISVTAAGPTVYAACTEQSARPFRAGLPLILSVLAGVLSRPASN